MEAQYVSINETKTMFEIGIAIFKNIKTSLIASRFSIKLTNH